MANYVEYIKVGSNESWPVRDKETEGRVSALENSSETVKQSVTELSGKVTTAEENVLALQSNVEDLSERVNTIEDKPECLPLTGGTLTGMLCLTEGVHYGDELPAPGNIGRIFFKKVKKVTT